MTQRFKQFGFLAACASLLMLTACGDTNTSDGEVLSELLAPEVEGIVVNPQTADPVEVEAMVSRSEQISRADARAIAAIAITQVYLPDEPVPSELDDLRDFSPHVNVVELPSLENDKLNRIQRVFSAQGYICRPDDNQFNQYVNVVCVRADAAQEQEQGR